MARRFTCLEKIFCVKGNLKIGNFKVRVQHTLYSLTTESFVEKKWGQVARRLHQAPLCRTTGLWSPHWKWLRKVYTAGNILQNQAFLKSRVFSSHCPYCLFRYPLPLGRGTVSTNRLTKQLAATQPGRPVWNRQDPNCPSMSSSIDHSPARPHFASQDTWMHALCTVWQG